MRAIMATNRLADSVDGKHGRVKTTRIIRAKTEEVDGKQGRVKTTDISNVLSLGICTTITCTGRNAVSGRW